MAVAPERDELLLDASQDTTRDGVHRGAVVHQVEIDVGHDARDFQDLVEHLAVLAGDGYDTVKELRLVQCGNDRGHLDGLGPSAEDRGI